MYPRLPPDYAVRPPTEEDIPTILGLLRDFDLAEIGQADPFTRETILHDWLDLNPSTDAWLIFAPDGLLAGYATLSVSGSGRLLSDGYVHPTQKGRGVGSTLIEVMEQRAAALIETQPADIRLVLYNNCYVSSEASCRLLEGQGYTLTRVFFRMEIELEAPPPAPVWPEGISVRACDGSPEDVRRVYEMVEEGFKDHWEHIPSTFEDWKEHMFAEPVDPALWFLAQEGDQTVGVALSRAQDDESGWVNRIAVLRPWRKQGLGMALLRHAFAAFYQRDIRKVSLGVDAQSLTGAQRLYERAGMHVAVQIAHYEKELRAGRDLLNES